MPIAVECSGCGGKFRAPDQAAGKRVKCPTCSTTIAVSNPGPPPGKTIAAGHSTQNAHPPGSDLPSRSRVVSGADCAPPSADLTGSDVRTVSPRNASLLAYGWDTSLHVSFSSLAVSLLGPCPALFVSLYFKVAGCPPSLLGRPSAHRS